MCGYASFFLVKSYVFSLTLSSVLTCSDEGICIHRYLWISLLIQGTNCLKADYRC